MVFHVGPLGGIDGFGAVISTDGATVIGASYLGTDKDDQAYFVDFDESYNAYFLGQSQGNYPVTSGVFSNPIGGQFVHKLSSDLSATIFSTKFGSGATNPDGTVVPDISPHCFPGE